MKTLMTALLLLCGPAFAQVVAIRADLMLDYLAVWRAAASPGLSAELVAMPANPLEDIESLRKIDFVMKDGRVVRRPGAAR